MKEIPYDLRIYQSARQFSVAAGAIEKHTRYGEGAAFAVQPFVTCAAFSVELYLKCLLSIRGFGNLRTHKLSKLFESLPEDDKQELRLLLGGAYKDLSLPMSFVEQGISALDHTFVEWRYVYEQSELVTVNLEFLRRFAWALQMVVKALRPEWWSNYSLERTPDSEQPSESGS